MIFLKDGLIEDDEGEACRYLVDVAEFSGIEDAPGMSASNFV